MWSVAQNTALCGILVFSVFYVRRVQICTARMSALDRFSERVEMTLLLSLVCHSCWCLPNSIFTGTNHVVLVALISHLELHLPSPLGTPLHTLAVQVELLSLI